MRKFKKLDKTSPLMPSAGKRRHKVQLPLTLPWFPPSYHLFCKYFAFCRSLIFFFWQKQNTMPPSWRDSGSIPEATNVAKDPARGEKTYDGVGGMIEFADCSCLKMLRCK